MNDFKPYFAESRYTFQVLENQPINAVVGNITAQDDDDGNAIFYMGSKLY